MKGRTMPDEMTKSKLLLLLQFRGKACELESKMLLFERACIGKGSMFKAMNIAMHSIDPDIQKWVKDIDELITEWKELHQ